MDAVSQATPASVSVKERRRKCNPLNGCTAKNAAVPCVRCGGNHAVQACGSLFAAREKERATFKMYHGIPASLEKQGVMEDNVAKKKAKWEEKKKGA